MCLICCLALTTTVLRFRSEFGARRISQCSSAECHKERGSRYGPHSPTTTKRRYVKAHSSFDLVPDDTCNRSMTNHWLPFILCRCVRLHRSQVWEPRDDSFATGTRYMVSFYFYIQPSLSIISEHIALYLNFPICRTHIEKSRQQVVLSQLFASSWLTRDKLICLVDKNPKHCVMMVGPFTRHYLLSIDFLILFLSTMLFSTVCV